jgi:hypothetical protein
MKILVSLLLVLSSSLLFAADSADKDLDLDSALKILGTTKAFSTEAHMIADDPDIKKNLGQVFLQQTAAIATIQKSHKNVDLKLLVPFLCFSTDPSVGPGPMNGHRDISKPTDNMDKQRADYPVFALILDMPGAAQSLETYCFDKNNPANYRVDAYHVLSYLDKDRTKKVADALTKEFQNTSATGFIGFINAILEGDAGTEFNGPVDPLQTYGPVNPLQTYARGLSQQQRWILIIALGAVLLVIAAAAAFIFGKRDAQRVPSPSFTTSNAKELSAPFPKPNISDQK